MSIMEMMMKNYYNNSKFLIKKTKKITLVVTHFSTRYSSHGSFQ